MIRALSLILISATLIACNSAPYKEKVRTPIKELASTNTAQTLRIWSTKVGSGTSKVKTVVRPLVSGDTVFANSLDGTIVALNLKTGAVLWQQKLKTRLDSGLGGNSTMLFVATTEGQVYALNRADGKVLWLSKSLGEVTAAPSASDALVLVRTTGGYTMALNLSGQKLWQRQHRPLPFNLKGAAEPVINGNRALIGTSNGEVHNIDLRDGSLIWAEPVTFPYGKTILERLVDVDAKPLIHGGFIYAVSLHGKLARLRPDSGDTVWETNFSSSTPPAIVADNLIASHDNGTVLAFSVTSGDRLWESRKLFGYDLSSPVAFGGLVAVGLKGFDSLVWLDGRTGQILAKTKVPGGNIISLSPSPYGVLAYSADGLVSLQQARSATQPEL